MIGTGESGHVGSEGKSKSALLQCRLPAPFIDLANWHVSVVYNWLPRGWIADYHGVREHLGALYCNSNLPSRESN